MNKKLILSLLLLLIESGNFQDADRAIQVKYIFRQLKTLI